MEEKQIIGLMKAAGLANKTHKQKTPTYNMTDQQLRDLEKRMYDKAYHDAYVNALNDSNDLLILLGCMYLIDNFHCKEPGLVKFLKYYERMNKLYGNGQYTLYDLSKTIKEETGLEVLQGDGKEFARKALERC